MLADMIDPNSVFFRVEGKEKEDVLREMTGKLCAGMDSSEEIIRAVLDRENERSTGLERGLAVPHCRTNVLKRIRVALAVLRDGMEWDSLDGKPAQYVFVVVGPRDKPEEYLKLLSEISRMMKSESVRERLAGARTAEEAIKALRQD